MVPAEIWGKTEIFSVLLSGELQFNETQCADKLKLVSAGILKLFPVKLLLQTT